MVNLMRCPLWLEWPKMKGYFGHMHSMKMQIYSIIFRKYLLQVPFCEEKIVQLVRVTFFQSDFLQNLYFIFYGIFYPKLCFCSPIHCPPDPSTNTETTNQKNKFFISFCLFVIVFFVRNSLIIELMKIQNL